MIEHLRSMAVFFAVVEKGSFRAAAQSLSLSPSVVSHHVSQLEKQLGVTLLYRSTRKLLLTDDGRLFHESCREMVHAAENGLDRLADHTDTLSGKLRVAVPAFLSASLFMEDAAAFANANPKVDLDISFRDGGRDLMEEGFDLGIQLQAGPQPDSSMRSSRLVDVEGVICATPRYLSERKKPRKPEDLEAMPWVSGRIKTVELHNKAGEAVTVKMTPRIKIDNTHAAHAFALQHIGMALLPHHFVESDLASGTLIRVLPNWEVELYGAYALWPPNASRASLSTRFVEFLRVQIAQHEAQQRLPRAASITD